MMTFAPSQHTRVDAMRYLYCDDEHYVTLDRIIEDVQDARGTDDIEPEHAVGLTLVMWVVVVVAMMVRR